MQPKLHTSISSTSSRKWAAAIILSAASFRMLMVLFVIISRINYRYDLEFMEGASLLDVVRIHLGQSLYVRPSLEYIPMLYPPLYFYLSAALANFTGISFLPLRLISLLSTLGCLTAIFSVVRNESNSSWIGVVAAASFLATFKLGGAWFDLARVDMLFLALTLTAIYCLRKETTSTSILAGILFSLAFLTKQTALPIFIVLAAATWLLFRKQTAAFVASFVGLSLPAYLYLNASTGGWYAYYVFTLAASHVIQWSALAGKLGSDFAPVTVMILLGIAPLALGFREVVDDKSHQYYYAAALALVAASVVARLNVGGWFNTLLPAYAGLAILFGLGLNWLVKRDGFAMINGNLFQAVLSLLILVQFLALGFDPSAQIPTPADRIIGDQTVAELQRAPGEVLVPFHNYLALFAGKQTYFHMIAYYEIRGDFSRAQSPDFWRVVRQFRAISPSLLIMDWTDENIREHDCYLTRPITYDSPAAFLPVTGTPLRPTIQYVKDSSCP